MTIFIFDLDSTLTRSELLPEIARAAGLDLDMARLTQAALDGTADFAASFRRRFELLAHTDIGLIHQTAAGIALDLHLARFIQKQPEQCIIATGNADLWVKPITDRLGCRVFASHAELDAQGRSCLQTILDKGAVMRGLRSELPAGTKIIAVGDSANDIPMFELADYAFAFAGVNRPAAAVIQAADECLDNGAALAARLESLALKEKG